ISEHGPRSRRRCRAKSTQGIPARVRRPCRLHLRCPAEHDDRLRAGLGRGEARGWSCSSARHATPRFMAQFPVERVAMKTVLVALLTIASRGALAAQWIGHPTTGIPGPPDGAPNLAAPPPRAPDGKPDLSGLWLKVSPKYARNIAADLKPEEIQPWARQRV